VAFSPDGHYLVTSSFDKTARLWDLKAADPTTAPLVLRGHKDQVTAVAFSRDGRYLVTGSIDTTVRLWDLNLEHLIVLACRTAGRNLAQTEWDQYFGTGVPYRRLYLGLPPGEGAPPNAP